MYHSSCTNNTLRVLGNVPFIAVHRIGKRQGREIKISINIKTKIKTNGIELTNFKFHVCSSFPIPEIRFHIPQKAMFTVPLPLPRIPASLTHLGSLL